MLIANFLGITLYLYLFWKRLKEDYAPEKVFNLAVLVLAGVLIGKIVSVYFAVNYQFWVSFASGFIFYLAGIYRMKINFFESLDAITVSYLPWISLLFLTDAVKERSLYNFLAFWVCLVLIFIYFFLNANYKKFTWYKSGRIGFSGVVTLFLAFLVKSFVSTGIELYFSLALVFSSLVLLFVLSYAKD